MTQAPTLPLPHRRAHDTRARLQQIPYLALEVALTADAPNPGQSSEKGRGGGEPAAPANLHVLDLLAIRDTSDYGTAPLLQLVECSRIIWESLDDDAKQAHPQPEIPDGGEPSWSSECGWLHQVWPTALAYLDASDLGWVEQCIADVYGRLATAARLSDPPRFQCTRLGCGATAELQAGGRWVMCRDGHTLDVEAEKGRHLSMQDWTLAECRRALVTYLAKRVPQSKLEKWVQRGDLKPVGWVKTHKGGRVSLYNFGAVARRVAEWERRHAERSEVAG